MAKGSEPAVRWSDFPGVPRACSACERPLTLELVGEFRNTWTYTGTVASKHTVFWCVDHRGGRV